MPDPQPEYNPVVLGFSQKSGPIDIPLRQAGKEFGRLPSSYGLVPVKKGRKNKKGLNLDLGKFLRERLENEGHNLKGDVLSFFKSWHRDYPSEFGFDPCFLSNINDPATLVNMIRDNEAVFTDLLTRDIRTDLVETGLVRKEIVNCIPDPDLYDTLIRILSKKADRLDNGLKKEQTRLALDRVKAVQILKKTAEVLSGEFPFPDPHVLKMYADEVAALLLKLPDSFHLKGLDGLCGIRGNGVEFEFAARDASYLMLGKLTGDCTADKRNFQTDIRIENIFWTIFSWILDQNYQILKVYLDGDFVMKAHMLPLYISDTGISKTRHNIFCPHQSEYTILALDAVETVRAFRDDLPDFSRSGLLDQKEMVFDRTMAFIRDLSKKMGIQAVYAEKFSNTGWIRDAFDGFDEIFLHVDHIQKIDQLEDVYSLARDLCIKSKWPPPTELFMEIQMKNIYLCPKNISRAPGVKSFAVIKGDPDLGIPMNKVIGI